MKISMISFNLNKDHGQLVYDYLKARCLFNHLFCEFQTGDLQNANRGFELAQLLDQFEIYFKFLTLGN